MENDVVITAWNTVLFDKFCRFKHLLTDGLSAHSEEALTRHAHREGTRVLDVSCGFGDTARRIAQCVGPRGEVVGVDCAGNFVTAAGDDARQASVDNVSFFSADVQTDDLRGPTTSHSHASAPCSSRGRGPRCATSARR
jgi:ubiquinone/menaquinone biosynthesis C-methylase UbiE